MTTIKSNNGKSIVNISISATGTIYAHHCNVCQGGIEKDLVECKSFSTVKRAEKWANKVLGI